MSGNVVELLKKGYSQKKNVNNFCASCSESFKNNYNKVSVALPCCHLIHNTCRSGKCMICSSPIKTGVSEDELMHIYKKNNEKFIYQYIIDTISMRRDNSSPYSYTEVAMKTPSLTSTTTFLLTSVTTQETFKEFTKMVIDLFKIKLTVKGRENLSPDAKIILPTHICYLDGLIIYNLFDTCFLRTPDQGDFVTNRIMEIHKDKLLYISKTDLHNSASMISEHVEKHGDMCIFPTGMMTRTNVLPRFRHFAFQTGYPVQPIVLQYESYVFCPDFKSWILAMLSHGEIKVSVNILPIEKGTFDINRIEKLRQNMGRLGNMALSRVAKYEPGIIY